MPESREEVKKMIHFTIVNYSLLLNDVPFA